MSRFARALLTPAGPSCLPCETGGATGWWSWGSCSKASFHSHPTSITERHLVLPLTSSGKVGRAQLSAPPMIVASALGEANHPTDKFLAVGADRV